MPKIIFGSLLKNRIKHSTDETEYSKKKSEKKALIEKASAKKNMLIQLRKEITQQQAHRVFEKKES